MNQAVTLIKRGGKVLAHLFLLSAACLPFGLVGDLLHVIERGQGEWSGYVRLFVGVILLALLLLWLGYIFPAITNAIWRKDELFRVPRRLSWLGRVR